MASALLDLTLTGCKTVAMAATTTLNVKNLTALGAERLAELLLDMATGNAAAKRRLRLELASQSGGGEAANEIRKALVTIAKARTMVDWRKIKALAQELDVQRAAIMTHVAPSLPAEAFELLWRFLTMAPAIHDRCDDSNGVVGDVFRQALADLGAVAAKSPLAPTVLADRVLQGITHNKYGQFDGLTALLAAPLGREGLQALKAGLEAFAARPPVRPHDEDRRIIGYGRDGPMYADDAEARHQAREVQSALQDIADALGDVDGFAAHFSAQERARPAIAAQIATRLLGAGRAEAALAALAAAEDEFRRRGNTPDWITVRIATLDALGRHDEAQGERWAMFERSLAAPHLRQFIKRLPDFDDEEAEIRALAHVANFPDMHRALQFLVEWPALERAADLVLTRQGQLDGNRYEVLSPAAEALETRYPLAATLLLRAMIDFTLINTRATRYDHAARHLRTCAHLAKRIEQFGERRDHAAYVAHLRSLHARKAAFWSA